MSAADASKRKASRASKAPQPSDKQLVPVDNGTAPKRVFKRPRKDKKVNTEQALMLKTEKGLTYREIAAIQGVDHAAVYRDIKHLLPDAETEVYKSKRADVLAKMQKELLKSITVDDIKGMPVGQKLMGYGILFDKERLERNQSTVIVSYDARAIEDKIREIQDRIDVIDAEIVDDAIPVDGIE